MPGYILCWQKDARTLITAIDETRSKVSLRKELPLQVSKIESSLLCQYSLAETQNATELLRAESARDECTGVENCILQVHCVELHTEFRIFHTLRSRHGVFATGHPFARTAPELGYTGRNCSLDDWFVFPIGRNYIKCIWSGKCACTITPLCVSARRFQRERKWKKATGRKKIIILCIVLIAIGSSVYTV